MTFLFDKHVDVYRHTTVLGAYNRPTTSLNLQGSYECHISQSSNNTAQLQPQKQNTTNMNLYTDPTADIKMGDVLKVYEVDEYGDAIEATCIKYIADRPYKKRTKLITPLLAQEEV